MKLVIAEKPSVAKSIAQVIGATKRSDGFFSGNGYLVSWCVGHLLGLANPQAYDEKYKKWRHEDLPIIPGANEWVYTANPSTKKQLNILSKLLKQDDVDCVINACDAGREGELIFRLVYDHTKCVKPMKRLWISSMEESAIEDGFRTLKDGSMYDTLNHAALCRQRADWLVGLNFTRLFSVLYNTSLKVGRVQTPTLAMIVEREDAICNFVKEPFYIVEISNEKFTAQREKLMERETAETISESCLLQVATVMDVRSIQKSISPPKLYDLTTLQREVNRSFGYTAAKTLTYVQSLYEKKLCTYPRTDSRFLTEDMAIKIVPMANEIATAINIQIASDTLDVSQVVNNKKVTDHHAIIPTKTMLKADLSELSLEERNILNMIAVRLISSLSQKHRYDETTVTLKCSNETFVAKGRTVVADGFKAIELPVETSTSPKKPESRTLPQFTVGDQIVVNSFVRESFTQPPKHFTEDLLLSAMETAGSADMPDDAERKGLGTPATRASIIENLVKSGFLKREKKMLMPTKTGDTLVKILPEEVKSPLLTAQWETDLLAIERGEVAQENFMDRIEQFVTQIVKSNDSPDSKYLALFAQKTAECVGTCPRCQSKVIESHKGYFCDNQQCKFALWKDNKFFTNKKKKITTEIAKKLLKDGRVSLCGLYSEKTGKTYGATVVLDDTGDGRVNFIMEFESNKGGTV